MSQLALLEYHDSIAILTLNRPERHNSLVPPLLQALLAALEEFNAIPDVRAVVLQANGRSFSTGGDIGGFYEHRDNLAGYAGHIVGLLNQVIMAMMNLPVPVVAAVQGMVTGGSLGLVLAADVVLVAPEVIFRPYYSVVGFSPDGGWTAILPAIIGSKRAAEILMRNKTVTAEEAVHWGMASQIVPAVTIRQEAMAVARELVAKKPGSIRRMKHLLVERSGDVAHRLDLEKEQFVRQITTPEAHQGILAFLEGKI